MGAGPAVPARRRDRQVMLVAATVVVQAIAAAFFVADAIGGISTATHEAAMQRMIQAGATPISVIGLAGELQRDWGREGADKLRAALRAYFGRMR